MGVLTTCDLCKNGVNVRHYALRRYRRLAPNESSGNASNQWQGKFEAAGSLDLCDACWERKAKIHMRPQRRPETVHNQYTERRPNRTQGERDKAASAVMDNSGGWSHR